VIRNVPELRKKRSFVATARAPTTGYVERFSRPANLGSMTAYMLSFCHNILSRREENGLEFKTVFCLHLYDAGSS
jgi:hypothetical protein